LHLQTNGSKIAEGSLTPVSDIKSPVSGKIKIKIRKETILTKNKGNAGSLKNQKNLVIRSLQARLRHKSSSPFQWCEIFKV
jgi:hypothetical protein